MITYQDRTFCISKKCNNECDRQLTKEILMKATLEELPISVSTFCGKEKM